MEDQVTVEFDPDTHHRRSIRLKGYDYSQAGAYFFTICTRDRGCLFGEIVDGEMRLNSLGEIVQDCWDDLPRHYPQIELDAFVIMPNHVHGIVFITDVGAQFIAPSAQDTNHAPTLGEIVRAFKARSTRLIRKTDDGTMKQDAINCAPTGFGWQRNYYEHIIRDETALNNIRRYIIENPLRWADDEENPINIRTGEKVCL